jgi:hypothetical protein
MGACIDPYTCGVDVQRKGEEVAPSPAAAGPGPAGSPYAGAGWPGQGQGQGAGGGAPNNHHALGMDQQVR